MDAKTAESGAARGPDAGRTWHPVEVARPLPASAANASAEIAAAVRDAATWMALAHRDIRARYRRTVLGPFWILLLAVVSAAGITAVYGVLLDRPFGSYFLFVLASLVSWTFISGTITEAASLLWLSGVLMKTYQLSPVSLVLANLWKNLVVWAHAVIPAALGAVFLSEGDRASLLLLPLGVALVAANLGWLALIIAVLGARFRDLHDLVLTVMFLAFLVTPVIWDVAMLGEHRLIADINPLAHLLGLMRMPLIGTSPGLLVMAGAAVTAILGWIAAALVYRSVRHRLSFWV